MIDSIGLQITEKCNRSCPHCCGNYGPDPSKGRDMPLEISKKYIDQLPVHKVNNVTISGGEPTLSENLNEIIYQLDITKKRTGYPKKISMISNCSFVGGVDETLEKLYDWKALGLDFLSLSHDKYHNQNDKAAAKTLCIIYNEYLSEKSKRDLPRVELQDIRLIPLGRAKNLPREEWIKKRSGKIFFPCSLDGWAEYYIEEISQKDLTGISKNLFLSLEGIHICDFSTNVFKIGEHNETIEHAKQNVKDIGLLISLFSYFGPGPKKALDLLGNYYDLPQCEHDCIACHEFFDNTDKKLVMEISSDEKIIKKLIKDNLKII